MTNFIKKLQKENLITIIDQEVDIYLEIAHIAYIKIKQDNSKVLLFTNVVDKKNNKKFTTPVMINLFSSFKMIQNTIGNIDKLEQEISSLSKMHMPAGFLNKISLAKDLFHLKSIFPKRLKIKGACQEKIYTKEDINLYNLPILTTWEKDIAPFITMGQVYTQSLDGKRRNLGMYRLQVHNKNQLGLHFQIHKDSNIFLNEYKRPFRKT